MKAWSGFQTLPTGDSVCPKDMGIKDKEHLQDQCQVRQETKQAAYLACKPQLWQLKRAHRTMNL